MKVRVEVFLKPGVLDVQGKAIEAALHGLGFPAASGVRVGRVVAMELAAESADAARAAGETMADRLLANGVIESYQVAVEG